MSATQRILVVVTDTWEFRQAGYRTGLWLGELTHFWDVLASAGYQIEIASPKGGVVPIDPESLFVTGMGAALGMKGDLHRHYEDRNFMDILANATKLDTVDAARFDAIYLTGGHGVMFDFPGNETLARLLVEFYQSGKFVTAVCHGPSGLLGVKLDDGRPLVEGRRITGFSWREETLVKRDHVVPFSLENELRIQGARYSTAALPFVAHVVEDGLFVTGQNPASARGVGMALLNRLNGDIVPETESLWPQAI